MVAKTRKKKPKSADTMIMPLRYTYQKQQEILETISLASHKKIYQKVESLALSGTQWACRYILDRSLPIIPKDNPVILDFPDINTIHELEYAVNLVINYMKTGEITPLEAIGIINILAEKRKVIEARDIINELEILEPSH